MIKLDKDIYDTLELMAYVYEGVGGGETFRDNATNDPYCLYGLAIDAEGKNNDVDTISRALDDAGFSPSDSDRIVNKINKDNGKSDDELNERVSWEEYRKAAGFVRK